jgi:hypothetical protein
VTIGDPSELRPGFAIADSVAEVVAAAAGIIDVESVVDMWTNGYVSGWVVRKMWISRSRSKYVCLLFPDGRNGKKVVKFKKATLNLMNVEAMPDRFRYTQIPIIHLTEARELQEHCRRMQEKRHSHILFLAACGAKQKRAAACPACSSRVSTLAEVAEVGLWWCEYL